MKKIVIVIIGIAMLVGSFMVGAYVGCQKGARAVCDVQLECWSELEVGESITEDLSNWNYGDNTYYGEVTLTRTK